MSWLGWGCPTTKLKPPFGPVPWSSTMNTAENTTTMNSAMNTLTATTTGNYMVVRLHATVPAGGAGAAAPGDGPATATASATKPINIGILLDTSGSMEGERLQSVKRTLHAARALFQPADRVTLVTFDDTARVITDHQHMDAAGLEAFYTAVDAVRANGCTNLSCGIEALYGRGTDYDMVLILTDGLLNGGVTSSAGIEAMLNAPGRRTINTFGYGLDHCRALLRDLALKSRGSYTYIDTDEILPVAMGDMLAGLRDEVLVRAELTLPAGWRCEEIGGGGASFQLGNIVQGRDYWYVFRCDDPAAQAVAPVRLEAADGYREELAVVTRIAADAEVPVELTEQILRCRVARVLFQTSEAMESARPLPRAEASALIAEIEALPAAVGVRPMVLRMRGQLAEILAEPEVPPPPSMGPVVGGLGRSPAGWPGRSLGIGPSVSGLAARMASGMTVLCNQRGVMSSGGESVTGVVDDPDRSISLFSSPSQRTGSEQVRGAYTGRAQAHARGPPIAPVGTPPASQESDVNPSDASDSDVE